VRCRPMSKKKVLKKRAEVSPFLRGVNAVLESIKENTEERVDEVKNASKMRVLKVSKTRTTRAWREFRQSMVLSIVQ